MDKKNLNAEKPLQNLISPAKQSVKNNHTKPILQQICSTNILEK